MEEEVNVSYDKLINMFAFQNVIFNSLYHKLAQTLDNDELKSFLPDLYETINYNYQEQIYSSNIKDNFYRLFSVYREKFRDEDVLNTVNELITILNKSGDENALSFIFDQYEMRFSNQFSKRELRRIYAWNRFELERVVGQSICNDYYFLRELKMSSNDDFLEYASLQSLPLSNLTFMLINYPIFLKNEGLIPKILDLLYSNLERLKNEKLKLPGIKYQTQDCLQKIRKLKLDKS